MANTVYTPKKMGHDYSDAGRFGEIAVVFDRSMSPFQLRAAHEIVERFLEKTPPKVGDSMLLSGPASLNIVLANCLLARLPRLPVLIFHARDRIYIERELRREDPKDGG